MGYDLVDKITELLNKFRDRCCLSDMKELTKQMVVFVSIKTCTNSFGEGGSGHRTNSGLHGLKPESSRTSQAHNSKFYP